MNHSNDKKHSSQKPIRLIVAGGRLRFLVRYTLVGTVVLWMVVNGLFMIRGSFHGLGVAYVIFLETVSLLIAIPFALAIAYNQWRKFHQMASMETSSLGDQNATRSQNQGERK